MADKKELQTTDLSDPRFTIKRAPREEVPIRPKPTGR